ncbi:MAG TPA: 16S rRNA (uracil(1498)-N(3))-methyltransferase [Acidobacteriaceae bacterium]|jgi:16S rRNA (uracil1498-N3)-methyltransferase
MTRRRWIADSWDEATASLTGEQAAHLIRVLRAQKGMEFDVVAGGNVWRAAITGISGDTVLFTLLSEVEAAPALPVTVLLSIFKFDRMEWMIEKATELGVERMVPMIARRSEKHLAQSAPARVERWRRISREAAKQSRRSDVPLIDDVISLKDAVRGKPFGHASAPDSGLPLRLLLAEQEEVTTLHAAVVSALNQHRAKEPRLRIALAVGPEGGWTAEEETLFADGGWKPVSLGPRILRAETAGIAAMAVVASLIGPE